MGLIYLELWREERGLVVDVPGRSAGVASTQWPSRRSHVAIPPVSVAATSTRSFPMAVSAAMLVAEIARQNPEAARGQTLARCARAVAAACF